MAHAAFKHRAAAGEKDESQGTPGAGPQPIAIAAFQGRTETTTPRPSLASASRAATLSSQGQRSASVSGIPADIRAMFFRRMQRVTLDEIETESRGDPETDRALPATADPHDHDRPLGFFLLRHYEAASSRSVELGHFGQALDADLRGVAGGAEGFEASRHTWLIKAVEGFR